MSEEGIMKNIRCIQCKWYDGCGGWANWCKHPENLIYCTDPIKDFVLSGRATELNIDNNCNKFEQIKGVRKLLRWRAW